MRNYYLLWSFDNKQHMKINPINWFISISTPLISIWNSMVEKKRFVLIAQVKTCDYLSLINDIRIFVTAGHEMMVIWMCMFIDPWKIYVSNNRVRIKRDKRLLKGRSSYFLLGQLVASDRVKFLFKKEEKI